jgi:DNA phosphorothioation-associated DGQHR protein 1
MTRSTFPFTTKAVLIDQPMSKFYAASIPADVLLQVAFSDVMSATMKADGNGYTVEATQRARRDDRLRLIAAYIDREDSSFPNSIIVAANYGEDGLIEQDENPALPARRWTIEQDGCGGYDITIPTPDKLAAVIDGQHRLFAFAQSNREDRLGMNLLCSVFFDLQKPYQAQLFATINSTQKPVDKSLTYELFGYNVEDEPEEMWSPDKLAVFLTRKLATEQDSPLRGRIAVAPQLDETLQALAGQGDWKISTAVVVEGIMRLFSTNPTRDTEAMLTPTRQSRAVLAEGPKDASPLRDYFIGVRDNVIYTMTKNFLKACQDVFWSQAKPESFITRAVGVQALFDVFRKQLVVASLEATDLRTQFFVDALAPAASLDFAAEEFKKASGTGRTLIRRAIEEALSLAAKP